MHLESFLTYLKQTVSLTEEEKTIVLTKLKTRTFLKGQYIVQAGDIYKFQTFIVSGKVKTSYMDQSGNEHIIAFGIENWWTGDICSFTNQEPAEFDTQCLEKTTVVQISYDNMEELYERVPKLERFFRQIVERAYGLMSKRVVRNHSMPAKERYLLFLESYPEIYRRFPQYMIASYLGITKEFLSSIKKELSTM